MMTKTPNPWNLTPKECKTLDAVCEHGSIRLAALAVHRSRHTLMQHTRKAGVKMGNSHSIVLKCLMWDRWKRESL